MSDEDLIAAWHGTDSVDRITARFGVDRTKILARWKQLRALGRLPPAVRRLTSLEMDARYDGRPDVGSDKLLKMLKKMHG